MGIEPITVIVLQRLNSKVDLKTIVSEKNPKEFADMAVWTRGTTPGEFENRQQRQWAFASKAGGRHL